MDDSAWVADYLDRSLAATAALASSGRAVEALKGIARTIESCLRAGGKLLVAGNGGSAADAQHIAAEFVVRLMYDRAPLAALALTTDSSILTAAGNDYGFDQVFARQVRALGRPGDVFLGISTSGNSPSILNALMVARAGGLVTAGFGAAAGGAMAPLCDYLFLAEVGETAIAQQIHSIAAHVVCGLVERAMFPGGSP